MDATCDFSPGGGLWLTRLAPDLELQATPHFFIQPWACCGRRIGAKTSSKHHYYRENAASDLPTREGESNGGPVAAVAPFHLGPLCFVEVPKFRDGQKKLGNGRKKKMEM